MMIYISLLLTLAGVSLFLMAHIKEKFRGLILSIFGIVTYHQESIYLKSLLELNSILYMCLISAIMFIIFLYYTFLKENSK